MARLSLPEPVTARPLPPVDPYRHRHMYMSLLSALYHAENAALEGFKLLTDPRYVQANELFLKASQRLVADEEKHLQDIRRIVERLGYSDVLPPTASAAEFWTAWRSGKLFALPLKPSVAALFCLLSEGLGYAVLYNLAVTTSDPEIRAILLDNVEDEKVHLRLSLSILDRALRLNPDEFLLDSLVYGAGYALLTKKPVREHRDLIEDLGLDYDVIMGSSIRFVMELMTIALEQSGQKSSTWKALDVIARLVGENPISARALYLSTFLPTVPFSRQIVYGWGRIGLRRSGIPPAPPGVFG